MLTPRSAIGVHQLSESAMDLALSFGSAGLLRTVYFRASVPITEEVEIWLDAAEGPDYDTMIGSGVLSDQQDYVFAASGDIALCEGDQIRVTCTNANGIGQVNVKGVATV